MHVFRVSVNASCSNSNRKKCSTAWLTSVMEETVPVHKHHLLRGHIYFPAVQNKAPASPFILKNTMRGM